MMKLSDILRVVDPIKRRIFNLVSRSVVESVDNTGTTQTMKVTALKDEILDKIERIQEFGLESYPSADGDAEAIIISLNGIRDVTFAIKTHNRKKRPTGLTEGGTCLYGEDTAGGVTNKITISPTEDTITIEQKNGKKIVIGPTGITMLEGTEPFIKGTTFDSWITSTLLTIFNTHTHAGVTTGGGSTAVPSSPLTAPSNHLSTEIKGK